ncbi:S-layer homology domain-containing protein [Candidatus Dojkabacteria bacterium]|uniref:S-layer homology domain-containing protein n=1 Tax=Candidatus Dojkabacteria bacterium TaxID=2099670 RepID=A0A955L8I9_9BACT|nr:S-layer homology domain-containing protein [Candidatus Dojkabacteria bacterium]
MNLKLPMKLAFLLLSIPLLLLSVTRLSHAQTIKSSCNSIQQFDDIPNGHTFCVYIEYLLYQGVLSENPSYNPEDTLNRGQLAKMIVTSLQLPEDTSGDKFPDVPSNHTFFSPIMTLKNSGIIGGYPDGDFKPDNPVTRGALMKFIVNAAKHKNSGFFDSTINNINSEFNDVPNDHSFAPFIASAVGESNQISNDVAKIIKGYSDKTFRPDTNVTRGEVSKAIANTMKYTELQNASCSDFYCQAELTSKLESDLESYLFELINTSRISNGKGALVFSDGARTVAKSWSGTMAQAGELSHQSNLIETLNTQGVGANGAGENVGFHQVLVTSGKQGYFDAVKTIHNLMMAEVPPDDGHRQNILGESLDFTHIGTGMHIKEEDASRNSVWMTEDYYK